MTEHRVSGNADSTVRFRRNIIANVFGQGWSGLLALLVVPFYLHLLGGEAFGLIGFFASVQAVIVVLDFGLSATANREIARGHAQALPPAVLRQRVRTLEALFLVVGLSIATFLAIAGYIWAPRLVNASELSTDVIRTAAAIVGVTIGLRWPLALYSGVMRGLERQEKLSLATAVNATLRHAGAVGAVLIARAIAANAALLVFFAWQLGVAFFEVGGLGWLARRALPPAESLPGFEWRFLKQSLAFSTRLGGISLFAAILKQLDKFVIAKLLPLELVGQYTVATAITGGLSLLVFPVFSATFPRLCALLARDDKREAARIYHRSSQLVCAMTAAAAACLMFYASDVLLWWTHSEVVSVGATPALRILAGAALLNSMMQIPYALQLAAGETWISLLMNGGAVVVLSPLMVVLVRTYGVVGAAYTWLLFNVLYVLIVPQLLHRHVLKGQRNSWYVSDNLPFIAGAFASFGLARTFTSLSSGVSILAAGMAYLIGLSLAWPPLRARVATLNQLVRSRMG